MPRLGECHRDKPSRAALPKSRYPFQLDSALLCPHYSESKTPDTVIHEHDSLGDLR
jgi:hypothetical protein